MPLLMHRLNLIGKIMNLMFDVNFCCIHMRNHFLLMFIVVFASVNIVQIVAEIEIYIYI